MIILAIRTDSENAEISLYDSATLLRTKTWPAHKTLAATIHLNIARLLDDESLQLNDLQAIAVYEGPGSFTGLRIGIAVANALAYAHGIPIAASTGTAWVATAQHILTIEPSLLSVLPAYGALPNITKPRH